jgi:PDZ domain/Secretion system C-terminal sorting domain
MKQLYIFSLLVFALCLTTTATGQEKTAPQNDKQVIVIKKTVAEDGTVTIEKTITTGEEGKQVFVTVDSDGTHEVKNIEGDADGNAFFISSGESEDGELHTIEVIVDCDSVNQKVWVTSGDCEKIVGENVEVIVNETDDGKTFTIVTAGDSDGDFESVVLKNIEVTVDEDSEGNNVWISSGDSEGVIVKNIDVTTDGNTESESVWVTSGSDEGSAGNTTNVNVVVNEDGKVITIVKDGKTEVIELAPGEELSEEQRAELLEKGVHIVDDHTMIGQDGEEAVFFSDDNTGLAKKIRVFTKKMTDFNFNFDESMNFAGIAGGGTNCIALGVFVNSDKEGGVNIQSIIDGSGAQDAGMKAGDIIHRIGEDQVENFGALHAALSHYEPGEVVTVEYERDGVSKTVEAELRAWGDLPNYENSWRAKVKCGEENNPGAPKVSKKIIIIKKNNTKEQVPEETVKEDPFANAVEDVDYALSLESFSAFPNPTDGKFNVRFQAEAKPITVSVFDATGKEIYRDNVKDFDGYYDEEIDLRGKSSGALILSIAQEGKRFNEQIILQ